MNHFVSDLFSVAIIGVYILAALSDAFWTAAFGALVALMLGWWNYTTAKAIRLAAEKADAAQKASEAKADTIKDAVQEVKAKAEVIVGHVNSEKTDGLGREALLAAKVELLERMIADQKGAAALLAQAAATTQSPAVAAAAPVAPAGAPEVLAKIEEHTEATAKNTATNPSVQ